MTNTTLPSGTPAHVRRTEGATRGLVVIPDIGGLRPLFTDMADRLADEHGWSVAVFEPWPSDPGPTVDERLTKVGTLDDARMGADAAAAADLLAVEPVAIMGFCMGGMFAIKAAAAGRFDRAVAFYGMVRLRPEWATATNAEPLAVLDAAVDPAPVLLLVGTDDGFVPEADADALARRPGTEVVRYPGAEHGFVHDPTRPTHRAADAADAWARVAGFLA